MRISQLADRSGVPATTLRFYESAGLLAAGRTPSGYRSYGEDAVQRLAFIGAAKHLGLPLEEIADLLAVWQTGACAQVKADLRPRIAARLAEAERRAAELAAFTASLHSALEHLDALPDRATPCDPECGFLSSPASTTAAGKPVGVVLSPDRAALDGAAGVEIPDGLRLTLPAERITALAELAAAEQQCCPFFDFRFHLDGRDVHLEVRAPAEGASLLAEVIAVVRPALSHDPFFERP
jgi:MerR family copper efflux transcriptional regulator